MRVNGIVLVSLYCDVCSLVSRLVTWALCLPVAKAESRQLGLLFGVGVVTTEAPKKFREGNGNFYASWVRGRIRQIVMRICWFVGNTSR